jgi:ribonuclease E
MKKEMLINVMQPEECRIAIIENNILEELYVERTSQESYVGNIYKGKIVNIEPSIQAAFVDFGIGRNGFLHVSDVEPAYYRHLEGRGEYEPRGRSFDRRGKDRPRRGRQSSRRRRPDYNDSRSASPLQRHLEEDLDRLEAESSSPETGESALPAGEADDRDHPASLETFPEPAGPGSEPGSVPAEEPAAAVAGHPIEAAAAASVADADLDEHDADADLDEHHADADLDEHDADADLDEHDADLPRAVGIDPEAPEERGAAGEPDNGSDEDLAGDSDEVEPIAQPVEMDELEELPESRLSALDSPEDEEFPEFTRRRRRGGGRRRPLGRPGSGRPKPLIQDIFKRGQEVLVQVIKEGIGTKGPTLSTYISIAGRYLVLMPGLNRVGVSRKIVDDEQRRRLREIFHELQPPKGIGFIIRTAGMDRTKKELQRDLAYLARLWQVVVRRIKKLKAPCEIYQESDMITRTIRDIFTSDIDTIWVDEANAYQHAQEFLQIVMPRYATRIKHFTDTEPIFYKYSIEDEIARIQQRHVPLPNGGSIVIDQTEALVAIDVNSGNFRADNNAEETAYQMNILAAKEIARQLRLRDLGGVIVNDFIDMREEKHRRGVERALREAVRRDRARTKILKISAFGIIEMTRQRIRPSLKRSVYQECPHCHATGQVKTIESMSIDVMRMLQLAAHRPGIARVQVRVMDDVAHYLLNKRRKELACLEERGQIQLTITGIPGAAPEALEFLCYDQNNGEVKLHSYEETRPRRR